jgi:hypothetical protein
MKTMTLAAMAALLSTSAFAGGYGNPCNRCGIDVSGLVVSGGVTAITSPLSSSANDYSATIANVRSIDVRIDPDRFRLDVENITAAFEDGYKSDPRGRMSGVGFDIEAFQLGN